MSPPPPSHTGLTLLSALAPSSPPREDQACPRAAGALQTARRLREVGPTFFRLDYSGYQGYVLLNLTELSSYLPLVPCFEFGNASGTLFPCTEGRVRTIMVPPGTPRAGAFSGEQSTRAAALQGACACLLAQPPGGRARATEAARRGLLAGSAA